MRRSGGAAVLVALLVAGVLTGCGSGGDTTVIEKRTTTVQTRAPQPKPASQTQKAAASTQRPAKKAEPTNTVGLPLDMAEELLRQDGYRVAAKNTDTTFGIIDPSNYTICTQGEPRGGTIVPVLAQKYGC